MPNMEHHMLPTDDKIKGAMIEALHEVLSYPNEDNKGNILIQRIPFICQDIREIRDSMDKITTHVANVEPILKEYNERQAAQSFAKRYGDVIKWATGILISGAATWAIFFK